MALSEAYTFNTSVSVTELSITGGTSSIQAITDAGVYQLFLDLSPMAAGDVFEIKLYEKVRSASTQRVCQTWTVAHAQGDPNWVSDSFLLLNGWDFTIKKLSGTDRTIEGSVRKAS